MDAIIVRKNQEIGSTLSQESIQQKMDGSVFWSRLLQWEYWPFALFYFPISFYWLWLSLKSRSLFFFTASNPSIEFGGMLGESKAKIYDIIPDQYIPKTLKVIPSIEVDQLKSLIDEEFQYPIICKPDIGERGWMVELIKTPHALEDYLDRIEVDFLIQEYVDYPIELGIFYYRYPDCEVGTISSVVMKVMLCVTGDGIHNIEELMATSARTKMHIENIRKKNPQLLSQIPVMQEHVEVNSIGNHSLGTTFLSGNHLINTKLITVFDDLSKQLDGFYFGRFDIRCTSIEDLYEGESFKILELNGAGSEPAHIYQPGYPLMDAYRDILHHLTVLHDISRTNNDRGISYMSYRDGIKEVLKIRNYNQKKPSI